MGDEFIDVYRIRFFTGILKGWKVGREESKKINMYRQQYVAVFLVNEIARMHNACNWKDIIISGVVLIIAGMGLWSVIKFFITDCPGT